MQCVWKFRTEDSDLPGSRLYREVCHSLLLVTGLNPLSVTHTHLCYVEHHSQCGVCSLEAEAGELSTIAGSVPCEHWTRCESSVRAT